MGYAIAEAAASLGAEVTLMQRAHGAQPRPAGALRLRDQRRRDGDRGEGARRGCDYFFSVAAVADYTPVTARDASSRRRRADGAQAQADRGHPRLRGALANGPFCVGFAAESENLADYAQAKRARKKIPMIVANLVQHTIGKEENEVTIYDDRAPIRSRARPSRRSPTASSRTRIELAEGRRAAKQSLP
jgi:phosphopantothenoylcysteine decarboxylase/phosphopantothenate--cysteine ligase